MKSDVVPVRDALGPFNPANRCHPDNPLNPANKYNSDVPFALLVGRYGMRSK
jgi:hypothetical protein